MPPDDSAEPALPPPTLNGVWFLLGCLIAICFFAVAPHFLRVRENNRSPDSGCQSNEKQINLAILGYIQDYDGTFPPSERWMEATQSYLKNDQIYHCPRATGDKAAPSYAYRDHLSHRREKEMKNPAREITLYDSTKTERNAHDSVTSLPVPGRHSGGNNIAYADGHVKWRKDP